jgi:hypothetical protein
MPSSLQALGLALAINLHRKLLDVHALAVGQERMKQHAFLKRRQRVAFCAIRLAPEHLSLRF